jgi:DUF4097 and DUF4098 domain-containing protein YvlB
MKRGWLAAVPLVAAVWSSGCYVGDFGYSYRESVEETRPLAANGTFRLENTNGRITISTWDEPRVRIEAEKAAGSRHALRDLEVVVKGEGDEVAVETRQPRIRWLGSSGRVEYRVTVPRKAHLSVRSVNGRVEIDGVEGPVKASTVNGSVELTELAGEVDASTVNGSVTARLTHLDPESRNEIDTTNGTVRLTLPRDADADLEARTVNGRIHCDFDLESEARSSRRRLEGRIGRGGARFELHTVNGSVHVSRGLATADARRPAEDEPGRDGR